MSEITQRWSSRKFWATMFWEGVVTVLLWANKLPPDAFVGLTTLLIGGYLAANVSQKIWAEKQP